MTDTRPAGDRPARQLREALGKEMRHLHTEVLYTEKTHFAAAERLERSHTVLGVIATVCSTSSAATIIADRGQILAGLLALAAAVTTGLHSLTKPEKLAEQHLGAGRQYAALRLQLRHHLDLDLTTLPPADLRQELTKVAERKCVIDERSPSTNSRDYAVADRKIKAGVFESD